MVVQPSWLARAFIRAAKAARSPPAASLASYGIALWAMTLAPIAVVAALRETSVIFGMLLAMWLLHERFTPLRGFSVLLVVGGAALLKLG